MNQTELLLPTIFHVGYLVQASPLEPSQPPQPPLEPSPPPPAAKTKKKPKVAARAAKKASEDAHFELVMEAAQTVTSILDSYGLCCSVLGSLAAKLYGNSRCPKDVDLLVSQDIYVTFPGTSAPIERELTAAELKDLVLRTNSRNFYLKMPRDPTAEYRILWYRESHGGPECKVDILVPGTLHLTFMYPDSVLWVSNVPLVPFALLLLHKLQGWDDHRVAEDTYKQQKQHKDAGDLRRLVALKQFAAGVKKEVGLPSIQSLFSDEFMRLTRERVKAYCKAFPDRAKDWQALGFEVS